VVLGQVFLRVLQFLPVGIILPWLSVLIYHLGMMVAAVQRYSLTPLTWMIWAIVSLHKEPVATRTDGHNVIYRRGSSRTACGLLVRFLIPDFLQLTEQNDYPLYVAKHSGLFQFKINRNNLHLLTLLKIHEDCQQWETYSVKHECLIGHGLQARQQSR
jgi:hypothetical protein